jgi:hypothetical protein
MSVLNLQVHTVLENLENNQTGGAHLSTPVFEPRHSDCAPVAQAMAAASAPGSRHHPPPCAPIKPVHGRVVLYLFASSTPTPSLCSLSPPLSARRLCSLVSTTNHPTLQLFELTRSTVVSSSSSSTQFELEPPAAAPDTRVPSAATSSPVSSSSTSTLHPPLTQPSVP